MANAFTVFCEIPEDSAVPTYAQITDISTDDDGTLRITTDQELILIPGENTAVLSLDGGENPCRFRSGCRRYHSGKIPDHDHEHSRPDQP